MLVLWLQPDPAGSAATRGCVITNAGQGSERGSSGWIHHHPPEAGSCRGTGGDQAVVVSSVPGMTTQGGQEWQEWPRHEQHTRGSDNVAAVSDMTSPSQGRGEGGWGRAGGVDMVAPVLASADEPMQDGTVPPGTSQVQPACQSTGQGVRLQIDLDTLGQDDFDLAGSALPGQSPAGEPGTATKKARKTHRGSKHRGRDRITPHQKTWHPDS